MSFMRHRWGMWVIPVAVTTVFVFGISQRYENWWILIVGVPLAVGVAVGVAAWSEREAKSVLKGMTRDE